MRKCSCDILEIICRLERELNHLIRKKCFCHEKTFKDCCCERKSCECKIKINEQVH